MKSPNVYSRLKGTLAFLASWFRFSCSCTASAGDRTPASTAVIMPIIVSCASLSFNVVSQAPKLLYHDTTKMSSEKFEGLPRAGPRRGLLVYRERGKRVLPLPARIHRARRGWVNLVFTEVAAILGDGRSAGIIQHGQKDGGEGDSQPGLWGRRTASVLSLNRPSEFAAELLMRHLLYVLAVEFNAL